MKTDHAVSAVILAAGNSSRMHCQKSFLPFDEERNFVEKILDTYLDAGISDITLVINACNEQRMRLILDANYHTYHIGMILNRFPEKGRFYSIGQGLKNVLNSGCFIQNVDNPFICKELLTEMISGLKNADHVVPAYVKKDGHPVLIGKDILQHILQLPEKDHDLRMVLKNFTKAVIAWPYSDILANINTREDYRKYFMSCALTA